MKVSDIISRVRNIAGDVEVLQFKDSDVLAWINDAMRECASDNNLLQKTATSSTVADQAKYAIPTDILKFHSIRVGGNDLPIITLDQAKDQGYLSSETGSPIACWVWAGNVTFYPAPSSVESLEIDYTRYPTEVAGEADEPEIPAMYHMRLVDYCLAQVAQQDDDLPRYQLKMEEFRTGVQNLKDQPEWEINEYPYMNVSARDRGDYYDEY